MMKQVLQVCREDWSARRRTVTERHTEQDVPPPDPLRGSRRRWARPVARRIVQPLQVFLETETSSAALLFGAALVALAWANAPFGSSYETFWGTDLTIGVGRWSLSHDLRGWVSDGLMTLFFLLAGLEIKRELLTGELRERRAAFLPIAGAAGGMIVPAAIYLAFTAGTDAASGFGAAMPTDVVFALAVLALARRLPPGLKALLLALAIVDDLGSVIVMSLTYPETVALGPLVVAVALVAAYGAVGRIGVRSVVLDVALGLAAWVAVSEAGVSPTIVGVALGLLTPAVARSRAGREETVGSPPLARAEAFLLPWVSFAVVPLFALAYAGIEVSRGTVADALGTRLGLGLVASRLIGKPLGIGLAIAGALALGAVLPEGVRPRQVLGMGAAAGIPFTVSLYIAQFSLPAALVPTATVAILLSGAACGALGFAILRGSGAARTP
jgi:Na+:H+ antiporter, NhaA family